MLDPQARAFLDMVAGAPPLDTQTPGANRVDLAGAIALTGPTAPVHAVEETTLTDGSVPPVAVRVIRPRPGDDLPVVVYLHGGGWVLGGPDLADTTTRDMAVAADAVVVNVDYRLAPEHRFPAAYDDALAVTRAVLDGGLPGVDPSRLGVVGSSAGGNLAAGVAREFRNEPGLRHQVLIYPVTQARVGTTASYAEYGAGHFLTARDMQYFFDCYAPGVDPDDPRLAPLADPDLAGLAPATVITGECDPLRDEAEAYASAMAAAGVEVTARRFDGQVHPFVYVAGVIDDGHVARALVAEQLRRAFALAA